MKTGTGCCRLRVLVEPTKGWARELKIRCEKKNWTRPKMALAHTSDEWNEMGKKWEE